MVYCKHRDKKIVYIIKEATHLVKSEEKDNLYYYGSMAVCENCGSELEVEEVSMLDKKAFFKAYRKEK